MAVMTFPLPKRIAKSTLSQYLRTRCDRQLYLSLHMPAALEEAGMPAPMPARPGVGVLTTEGRTFEQERNEKLVQAFGKDVLFAKTVAGAARQESLDVLLAAVKQTPSFLLQGKIEPSKFRDRILRNLGIDPRHQQIIPKFDGLIPDIVIVREPDSRDEAVTTHGARRSLNAQDQAKKALVVIDVKHTSEANPSYSAEVAFYALMLANWLEETGYDSKYFVAVDCALWTRFKEGHSAFEDALTQLPAPGHATLLDALMSDCENANLRFYLPTVLRFFREDLPRVIELADTDTQAWRNLEWHVDSRCSACDFLGYARWVPDEFKAKIRDNPEHYCYPAADLAQHLSRIAGMTRGGRKTLLGASIATTSAIAGTTGNEPVYKKHTFLKREGAKLPARARALATNALDTDTTALLATIAPWPQLSLSIAVNFDPSAGLLTGLAIGGSATAYVRGQKPLYWKHQGFVVDQKTLAAEWAELKAFLSTVSDYIDQANAYVTRHQKAPLKGQISFWEARQYEELCAAVGRHLPKVLALTDRKQRALAWMFPPEELLERDTGAIPPCILFVDQVIRRVVFAPVPHVITLFDTGEHYHAGTYSPVEKDAFYREFLTNGVPRERIYEIWSNQANIQRGRQIKSRNSVVAEYSNSLAKQSNSIASIVERLRDDFRGSIKASNPAIDLSNPIGTQGVAFDAKLWIWWDKLGLATARAAAHQRLALDGQALEADYEALRLRNGVRIGATDEWWFDVLPTSTEAKIDEGDSYLAVGSDLAPGFPLTSPRDHLPSPTPAYAGGAAELNMPLYGSLRATLVSFDRVAARARVRVETPRAPALLPYLRRHGVLDLSQPLFLTAGKSTFDWSKTSASILRLVGNPSIAVPDPSAALAMGATIPNGGGNARSTPLARLLWDAPNLDRQQVMTPAVAREVAQEAARAHGLNPSQRDAVEHAAGRALTIFWGPPGTGKTKTLAACLHGMIRRAQSSGQALKVLVAGPTYKAVEQLVGDVTSFLDSDPSCAAELFVCYSAGRQQMGFPALRSHLKAATIEASEIDALCAPKLIDHTTTTIVATHVMQSHKFANSVGQADMFPVFDVVVLDESSQIEVTRALAPLGTLKEGGRALIAGDHLQMPPISALEPPAGAEYLVGSIQAYLLRRPFQSGTVSTCDLTENYRSNEDIVAYARTLGYPPALKAHYPQTAIHPLKAVPNRSTGFPAGLPFWNELEQVARATPAVMTILHDDDLASQGNEIEAGIVTSIVWALRETMSAELDGQGSQSHQPPTSEQFWGQGVGIVTPHRAQRALIIRELTKLFPADASLIASAVDTVERFQGGQRHAIVVSFGVGDADVIAGEEAFLMQLERTNVAISRAQAKCIVVMPTTLAGHVPQDKKALLTAHGIKTYVDDFCSQTQPIVIVLPDGSTRKGQMRHHA